MTKNQVRTKYKALRKKLSADGIDDMSIDIANNLLKLDIWHYEYYHIFLPIEEQKEVNTEFVLNILSGKDKNIVISRSSFKTMDMHHYLLMDSTRIKKNDYGIPEPVNGLEVASSKLDVVFVPLLAYDSLGNRVGYGKGFYDRFLSKCRNDAIKIGLSFFDAEPLIEDTHPNDVRLDYCVTPSTIFEF